MTMNHNVSKYILDHLRGGQPVFSNYDRHPQDFTEDDVAKGIEWLSEQGYIVADFSKKPGKPQHAHAKALRLSGEMFRKSLMSS